MTFRTPLKMHEELSFSLFFTGKTRGGQSTYRDFCSPGITEAQLDLPCVTLLSLFRECLWLLSVEAQTKCHPPEIIF